MAGPVRVQCSNCKELFDVPSEVIGTDGSHNVIVRMDRSELYGHLAKCVADRPALREPGVAPTPAATPAVRQPAKWPTHPALPGRINLMLNRGDYVAQGGSRACTMCGTKGADCLDVLQLDGKGKPCCASCGEGNTHPAPGEAVGVCAEWAAEKVGPLR